MADYTIEVSVPNVGPAGPEATVPPPAYASAGAAVDAGKPFGGLYRNTDGTVGWIEEVDPDVQAYLNLTGATARWAIQSFVAGVKALGLWDNMLGWTFRTAQNRNTGVTIYSLGGFGPYNATVSVGPTTPLPTRGASGAVFLQTGQEVALPLIQAAATITANGGYSSFTALNFLSRSSEDSNFAQRLNQNISGGQLYTAASSEDARAAASKLDGSPPGERFTTQSLAAGTFVGAGFKTMFGTLRTDGTGFSIINGAAADNTVSTFSSPVPPPFADGAAGRLMNNVGNFWTGSVTLAAHFFFLEPVSAVDAAALRTLYNNSLGAGL
jgi:hypothetical protein